MRAFDSEDDRDIAEQTQSESSNNTSESTKPFLEDEYPSGEFQFEKLSGWKSFVVKLRMLIAYPWERVRKGSVLTMKLRGQVLIYFSDFV